MRFFRVVAGVTVAAATCWAAFANSQVAGASSDSESDEPGTPIAADAEAPAEDEEELFQGRVTEEITVIVGPQGKTAYELEEQRLAIIRDVVYADMRMRERSEEELAWRQADPDLEDRESRIKWGYSPQAEQRMRRENDFMHDLSFERNKPASIFRVEF